ARVRAIGSDQGVCVQCKQSKSTPEPILQSAAPSRGTTPSAWAFGRRGGPRRERVILGRSVTGWAQKGDSQNYGTRAALCAAPLRQSLFRSSTTSAAFDRFGTDRAELEAG